MQFILKNVDAILKSWVFITENICFVLVNGKISNYNDGTIFWN